MKSIICLVIMGAIVCGQVAPTPRVFRPAQVRIKDIGKILEVRDNQLLGFGLVVGLRNTGDSKRSIFTNKALTNLLTRMGLSPDSNDLFQSRNVAGVMVTAKLPAYAKKGQAIGVTVSSIGDAISLSGGTLLVSELKGADMATYVVAQGSVIVGGVASKTNKVTLLRDSTTVGRIPDGGIVEKEVSVTLSDQHHITLVLNDANFITASRVADAINRAGFFGAMAMDASTIKVPLANLEDGSMVDLMARLESVSVRPDTLAKVVINARTGTIVIGEKVRLMPVALSHGGISIRIGQTRSKQHIGRVAKRPAIQKKTKTKINVAQSKGRVVELRPQATLSSLVRSLNRIGATPKDLISIIQALQASGALVAEVEVI